MAVARSPRRGDVYLTQLSSTRGSEIRKTRPCVVVSPDELNAHLTTFIAAPLTTGGHPYPFRVACRFGGKDGHVIVDQIRVVDREHLTRRLGTLPEPTLKRVLDVLHQMFAW